MSARTLPEGTHVECAACGRPLSCEVDQFTTHQLRVKVEHCSYCANSAPICARCGGDDIECNDCGGKVMVVP